MRKRDIYPLCREPIQKLYLIGAFQALFDRGRALISLGREGSMIGKTEEKKNLDVGIAVSWATLRTSAMN